MNGPKKRTLIYVAMAHRQCETIVDVQTKRTRADHIAEEQSEEALLGFWIDSIHQTQYVLKKLRAKRVYLFQEGWTSCNNWHNLVRNARRLTQEYNGVQSFSAAMVLAGATPCVTEDHLAYKWMGLFHERMNKLSRVTKSIMMPYWDQWDVRRDKEIASRLCAKVAPGEVAILTMGAFHDVPYYLDQNWRVVVLTHPKFYFDTLEDKSRPARRWVQLYKEVIEG